MKNFECHITIKGERDDVSPIVNEMGDGWSFSCIDGDPVLGLQEYCYATNHYETERGARLGISVWASYLSRMGLDIVRGKVEQVIFDSRTEPEWLQTVKSEKPK
jgi:hypothetical protein